MYRPCQDWPQDIGTSSDKHLHSKHISYIVYMFSLSRADALKIIFL